MNMFGMSPGISALIAAQQRQAAMLVDLTQQVSAMQISIFQSGMAALQAMQAPWQFPLPSPYATHRSTTRPVPSRRPEQTPDPTRESPAPQRPASVDWEADPSGLPVLSGHGEAVARPAESEIVGAGAVHKTTTAPSGIPIIEVPISAEAAHRDASGLPIIGGDAPAGDAHSGEIPILPAGPESTSDPSGVPIIAGPAEVAGTDAAGIPIIGVSKTAPEAPEPPQKPFKAR